jgi:hypothetical protein
MAEMAADLKPQTAPRVRTFAAVLLIVLAALLAPLSIVAVWADADVGDTDRYVSTMAPLADDPDVRNAVADQVTDAVVQRLNVAGVFEGSSDLPWLSEALGKVAGPVNDGLSTLVHKAVEKFVDSNAFASVWNDLNRSAHASVEQALSGEDGGNGAVRLTDNTVTLDLAPVIAQVRQRLMDDGLPLASAIPEVHTSFTLLTSDAVGKAKEGYRLLRVLGFWLPVAALACAVGGLLLAVRRRRALTALALGVAAGTALLGVAIWILRVRYLGDLPPELPRPAAAAVFDALAGFLWTAVGMVTGAALVVALVVWLTGRHAGHRAKP